MLSLILSVALLSLLLVDVQCEAEAWNSCSQSVVGSLQGIVNSLGKNQVILQDMSVCNKLTIDLKDVEAHAGCALKKCEGDEPDCNEVKLSVHVKNVTFKCEIRDAGIVMKELDPSLPTIKAKSELTVDGVWSELIFTVTFRVACSKDKGTADVLNSKIDSKPGALSISCSEGAEPLKSRCNSSDSRDKLSKYAEQKFQEKASEKLNGLSDNVANMNCA